MACGSVFFNVQDNSTSLKRCRLTPTGPPPPRPKRRPALAQLSSSLRVCAHLYTPGSHCLWSLSVRSDLSLSRHASCASAHKRSSSDHSRGACSTRAPRSPLRAGRLSATLFPRRLNSRRTKPDKNQSRVGRRSPLLVQDTSVGVVPQIAPGRTRGGRLEPASRRGGCGDDDASPYSRALFPQSSVVVDAGGLAPTVSRARCACRVR